jgi:endonuclease/exonuclease/phosphatase family metal-dependent hydrolase
MKISSLSVGIATSFALLSLVACSKTDSPAANNNTEPAQATVVSSVSIMTFNVENLFDTIDDPGKDDKAYLPIATKKSRQHIDECNQIPVDSWRDECLNMDWNEATLKFKLASLAETILQIGDGRGADIIVFQEVENAGVLDRLRNEYLADAGYQPAILIEGDDARGIDVAFLSKLPLAKPAELRRITFEDFPDKAGDTRHILEATFVLPDGSPLTGFAIHFPAPYQPTEMRVLAYEHLNALRDALPDDHHAFAAGDFNTTSTEDARLGMLDRFVRPHWIAAHDLCAGCAGTYYYGRDNNWSFLDMILFSPARGEKTTWQIRADSVQIANGNPAQVSESSTPAHFEPQNQRGVSDHWPLAIVIEPTQKQ